MTSSHMATADQTDFPSLEEKTPETMNGATVRVPRKQLTVVSRSTLRTCMNSAT